ncbi:ATP-binding protein [Actinoplanes sp. RD1]|uniref:ATP-binding protein n=1 Tax=Actinoplanes sp. RD1 TaxID=3064538 RepID=UPI002740FF7F|nr:ATP-binding protein [Actinoplanes sp. RD1]
MGTLQRRVPAGCVLLLVLFAGFAVAQAVVTDRLQTRHTARAARIEAARDANIAVLQHLTDAETGVRGFQLTGHEDFLEPYDHGRAGAFQALDAVAATTADPDVLRLLGEERSAASRWLYAYATPIVVGGEADPDYPLTQRGKDMFDRIRAANAAVDAAIRAQQQSMAAADRREARLVQLLVAGLGGLLLAGALGVGFWGYRYVLAPLDHVRLTLRRLAGGELSARAVPSGPAEIRTLIGTLNHLAAETERLHAADAARLLRTDLRQAVALELREHTHPGATARRVAAMIGEALHADAVHGRFLLGDDQAVDVTWPARAAALSARTVQDVVAGEPGAVRDVPHQAGAIAVTLAGDADCPPGLLYVVRRDRPHWADDERRLLAALAREIDHAARLQRLHDRQNRLIRDLRVLDERKDAFVATVTHELRTPLTSILGYTEMLADGDGGALSPLQERGVTAILRNAHRLQATVADLLLLDASGTPGEPATPVDLAAVAGAVHAEYAAQARTREIGFSGEAAAAWVKGDGRRLERALRNLLDNALKFTGPGGSVSYRVTVAGDTATLTVTDTGIGIPAGDLADLFTPFHRGANAMDQAVQGPGLGLAIVRTIVTEHGGDVQVTSTLGAGSTFTITLPLTAVPAPVPTA